MSDKASSPKKSPKSPSSGASEVVLHDAGHWAALAQDEQDEDADSSLGVDTESSTASMTSSILNYRTIKGRTYHSERGNAEYWASNDAQQNEAIDIIHHFLVLTLDGKLHLAPLKDDIKASVVLPHWNRYETPTPRQNTYSYDRLTGIWAIDFADEHPQAEVIGTDISPIQPSWVPPNVKFEIEDCTQPWTFSPDSFDFIYIRYLYGSISDWSALFQEAFRSCKPGGWVESFEASAMLESDDNTVKEGSAMSEWGKFFIEGGKRLGRTFTILDDDLQKKGMEDAGFTDIQIRDFKATYVSHHFVLHFPLPFITNIPAPSTRHLSQSAVATFELNFLTAYGTQTHTYYLYTIAAIQPRPYHGLPGACSWTYRAQLDSHAWERSRDSMPPSRASVSPRIADSCLHCLNPFPLLLDIGHNSQLVKVVRKYLALFGPYNTFILLALVKSLNHRELRMLSEEQQNLENQIGDLLTIHWDQSAEIAEWAEIPRAIFGDRINRHKAILGMQKRAIKIELRRELYSRFIHYLVTLEERKRGQQFSWRDFWLAAWIQTYCINIWIFDMVFSSIWAALDLFESFLAFATEPWGVELKLIITH
ncbi:mRNA 3 -end-processing YTH1 [Fusarium agapanthi]|uniref:mRNA 3 -end-processing YTH1 n=1 Tax=Fusarium agapanthi TaxID=1803897 RepID=A0A9P5BFV7_9HYPO|nr:mRNA 3 -end-processing YTH1 [Fusarium agapanthi]